MLHTSVGAVLCCVALVGSGALAQSCGKPDASHPPALSTSGDKILSVRHGIVGGASAEPYSYPWMVRLYSETHGTCGGALISDQWVLTAARCLYQKTRNGMKPLGSVRAVSAHEITASVGEHQRHKGTQVKVSQTVVNPAFSTWKHGDDIALVRLAQRVTFSGKVQPICLPSASDDYRSSAEKVLIAGWGLRRNTNYQDAATELDQAVLDLAKAQCDKRLWWDEVKMGDKELCTHSNSASSCCGDDGGPVMLLKSGRFTAVGVLARSNGCGGSYPGVQTHVPSYRQWIRQVAGV